ncbi:MAG: shikimate kinase [Candidatus Binatia bacterium]
MAVGKSAVGRTLARKLKRRFVDLDKIIEKTEGMKVSNIFTQKGELYFRQCEKDALKTVLEEENQVIATGGGAIIDEDNLRLVQNKALLVCLTANIDALLRRLGSGSKRPLLENTDRRIRMEELLLLREEKYAQAHLSIDTTDLTIDQVAERIIELAKLDR